MRYRMLKRPYARPTPGGSLAFYWLTRGDGTGVDRVIARGEGHLARLRIEKWLRQVADNRVGEEADRAARALHRGWEYRP